MYIDKLYIRMSIYIIHCTEPMLFLSFEADTPYYHCAVPSEEVTSFNDTIPWVSSGTSMKRHSGSLTYVDDASRVQDSQRPVRSQCTQYMYDNYSYSNDVTTTCQHGYWYDSKSGYDSTIVTEVGICTCVCVCVCVGGGGMDIIWLFYFRSYLL